jgi:hypothetical protein
MKYRQFIAHDLHVKALIMMFLLLILVGSFPPAAMAEVMGVRGNIINQPDRYVELATSSM